MRPVMRTRSPIVAFVIRSRNLPNRNDAIPLRIELPCFAFAAVVIGGNRDVSDVLGGFDPAEPSDDVKFDEVLRCLSPDRAVRNDLTDMTGARATCAPAKNKGSIYENCRRDAPLRSKTRRDWGQALTRLPEYRRCSPKAGEERCVRSWA
jgi:hypothetical protein